MAFLSIRMLGTLEIQLDGRPVSHFESDKVRALLVYLALAGSRPLRREKLATLLWPDYADTPALANLRRALYNLRLVLGDRESAQPFLLVTRQTVGFDDSSDVWVDASVITDLLRDLLPHFSGRASRASVDPKTIRRLEEAVALYRGEFLEGFSLADSPAFDEWSLFQQEQFHRQVMDALYYLGDWYECRGEREQALHYAWRQVELDPWRERGHRQVMRLLAQSGQRGAALVQYRACCQVLDQELGVGPEEETVQLYERIRDGTLEDLAAVPDGAQEPAVGPSMPGFLAEGREEHHIPRPVVARERELARLDGLLERAIGGLGQTAFVLGGPGRGKTALLGEFARRAMETYPELLAAMGRCNAYAGVGDPYLPFRDILAMLTGDVEAPWKAGVIGRDHALRLWNALPLMAQILLRRGSQVIPALLSGAALLSRATAAVPANTPWLHHLKERVEYQANQSDPGEQNRLFQQVANVLQDLAKDHPLLLILDDLQWIDSASACLLFHLSQRLGRSRILIAGAYRPEELAPRLLVTPLAESVSVDLQRHPLEEVLGEFKRRFGDIWIDLAAVDRTEARRFVDLLLDTEPNRLGESFRESLTRRAGGHPLFTIEILHLMLERGNLLRDEGRRWIEGPAQNWQALPARVEGVIEERVGRLDPDLRRLLTIASAQGEEFTVAVLAQLVGMDELELLQRLSGELEKRHRLVEEWGVQSVGSRRLVRYRFSHALVQQHLYNQLSLGERMLLHRQIARSLEELYEGATDEVAAQLAYHYAGDADRERYYSRLAGERAEAMCAHGEAMRYLSRALELTPEADLAERYALLLIRERAYHRQGRRDLQSQDLMNLTDLAAALGDGPRQAEVALRQSDYHRVTGRYDLAAEAAQAAIELAQPPEGERLARDAYHQAAGHLRWGQALLRQGDYPAARAQLEQTLALAETIPELAGAYSASPLVEESGKERSGRHPEVGSGPLDRTVDHYWRLKADSHRCLGVVCWHLGQSAAARVQYRLALEIYRQVKDRWGQATAINGLGVIAWSQGRAAEAWARFEKSLQYHEEVGDRRGQCRALSNLGDVRIYWGDYSEAGALFRQCLPISREIGERWIESGILNNLGVVADRLGLYHASLAYFESSLDMRREIGDRQGEAEGLSDLGLAYHHIGDNESSLEHSQRSLHIVRDLRAPFMLAFVLTRMGHALVGLDRLEGAIAAYREALSLRKKAGHTHLEVEPLAGLAEVALIQGEQGQALAYVNRILGQLRGDRVNSNDEPLRAHLTCYQVLRANGDPRAERVLDTAYKLLQERAARIDPEQLRRSFLEKVAVHREIVTAWNGRR